MKNNVFEKGRLHINTGRPKVKGKFLYCGNDKFYIKGVTYGTFKPHDDGHLFPDKHIVENDFREMSLHGINCVRTYTVPPLYLLDLAFQYNLKVMVGLPWEQHIAFLDDKSRKKDILNRVRNGVLSCNRHPSILCYTIGNEIPAPVVRWYGKEKVERFLKVLYKTVKAADPEGLVTYVNYPTTEYLNLDFLDFYSFNIYLESPEKLSAYISRLHNLCGDLPLVLAEIGMDSMRNGEEKQASTLDWQIRMIFLKGCAGMFVFAWTDEWWRGGNEIEDWDFGIVDRERNAKPALETVSKTMRAAPFLLEKEYLSVSVVVCSYNGSATIKDCLDGLINLNYPNYEIIIVNDGSTDNLAELVQQYPVKLINTRNRGLSNARNTGMRHSKGQLVAYIDDDAYPDPDWLHYLSYAFRHSDHAAIGGPNLVPSEDREISKCVASSPGGPVHVLLSDEIAEHIPGCNMVFRKEVLQEIGGFDPIYRSAGDDVDICWRIQESGRTIGFHPAALVWHHRRNSIKAYWKQQKGYGKAEALLESKWPHRYNSLGHYCWAGSIYGNGNTRSLQFKKRKIFYGTWGTALFQSVYQPAEFFFASIPLMPEWLMLCGFALVTALLGFIWPPLAWAWIVLFAALTVVVLQACISAFKNISKYPALGSKWTYKAITAWLHIMQPVARLYGRLKHGLTPWRKRGAGFNIKYLFTSRRSNLTYWSEKWHSTEEWLTGIEKNLTELKARVKRGGEFDAWDLHARNDLFSTSRCSLLIEEHGSGKQLVRLKYRLQIAPFAIAACLSGLVLSAFSWQDQNWLVTGILLVCSLLIFFRITKGYTNSRFTLYQAFKNLESQKRNQDFETDSNPLLNETIWSVEKKSMALNN